VEDGPNVVNYCLAIKPCDFQTKKTLILQYNKSIFQRSFMLQHSFMKSCSHSAEKFFCSRTLDENYTGYAVNLVPPISEHFHTYHVGECLKIDYDAVIHIWAFWG